jgi:hypothetical protein
MRTFVTVPHIAAISLATISLPVAILFAVLLVVFLCLKPLVLSLIRRTMVYYGVVMIYIIIMDEGDDDNYEK